jgi:CopG family nickel-responsive transcriptional regulator
MRMGVISVSIPKEDLKNFDDVMKKLGFSSRSDAIREALHRFVIQNKWIDSLDEITPFILTIVYPNKKEDAVHNTLHEFNDTIITATHTHYGEKCVEWVILKADQEKQKEFVQNITGIKDVMICRCSV